MVKVKIFCMQKDEEDILEEWILYHAHLFGMGNIYIIDNFSQEPSLNILRKYESKGLYWYQQPDYTKKGDYLYELIKKTKDECDLAIPLDIDEFIGFVDIEHMTPDFSRGLAQRFLSLQTNYYTTRYPQVKTEAKTLAEIREHYLKKGFHLNWVPCPEEQLKDVSDEDVTGFLKQYRDTILKHYPTATVSCNREKILSYLERLPKYDRYAFLYYLTSRNMEIDYTDPINEIQTFDLIDYETSDGKANYNKKFFNPRKLLFLDHGNHHGRVDGLSQNQYYNTQLVLFHYHHRGVRKLIEKCKNDILGLGFVKDLGNTKDLQDKVKKQVRGSHNIETYLTYRTIGPGALCVYDDEGYEIGCLAEVIKQLVTFPK